MSWTGQRFWSQAVGRFRNWRASDQRVRKALVSVDYYARRRRHWREASQHDLRTLFATIYRYNLWNNEESVSGGGSTLRRTQNLRQALPQLVAEHHIATIVDAGCGDFHWMREVRPHLPVVYTGVDIVPDLIAANERRYGSQDTRFVEMDITTQDLPRTDLVICRECLFHLSNAQILSAIHRFKASGSRLLLTTHYPDLEANSDIEPGSCRPLNFERDPFRFPRPLLSFAEDTPGQHLGLWELSGIQIRPR